VLLALAASGAAACGSLQVSKIAATAQRPSNVALYLDVRDGDGNGVPDLEEKNFKVYEDGKLVPAAKAKRAVLEPHGMGVRYTLVLIDLSGPAADSEDLPEIASTVGKFAEQMEGRQELAVSVFDGNDEVAPFLGFGAGAGAKQVKGLVEGIRQFRPRSRNTNWNGAIYQGLHALEQQLDDSPVPHKSAALVVFTDRGNDLSHAVGIDTMKSKVKSTPVEIFVIGAGPGINKPELTALGKNGAFLSSDPKAYKKGFPEIAHKLSSATDGKYIFSYCTTKRHGDHKVEVEVAAPPGSARVAYKFNADGFKAGCSAKKRPKFETEADAEKDKEKGRDREKDHEAEAEKEGGKNKEPASAPPADEEPRKADE
jgi:hypothetical protein